MAAKHRHDVRAGQLRQQRLAEGAGSAEHAATKICEAVIDFVTVTIEYERPTLAAAAKALSLNVRTLQRTLAAAPEGRSFAQILDEFRRDRAHALLSGRQAIGITDTAFQLGYADSGHFTRAFWRWTDCSPREFAAADCLPSESLQRSGSRAERQPRHRPCTAPTSADCRQVELQ